MLCTNIKIELKGNSLGVSETAEMWSLYKPYFHYDFASFYKRMATNTHYALYRRKGKLVGFTGLRIEKLKCDGKRYLTIYFGQTIVAPGVRGKGLINRTGLLVLGRYWLDFLTHRVVFWADALSYRAYLVFAKNLEEYYPNYRADLPPEMRKLRDYLGQKHYGERYCPERGIVQKDHFVLRDPAMLIKPQQQADRDIRCFVKANPDYTAGSGLLTLGPAHLRNLRLMQRKVRTKQQTYTPLKVCLPKLVAEPTL